MRTHVAGRAGHDHMLQIRQRAEQRREDRQQRRRDDQRHRAAVAQHVVVILGREQRVSRHRHDARLDRAKKDRRKIDRVEEAQQDSLLALQTQSGERIGAAIHALGEIAVRVGPGVVDVGDLAGAARAVGCVRRGRARRCSRAECRAAARSSQSVRTGGRHGDSSWSFFATAVTISRCRYWPRSASHALVNSIAPCGSRYSTNALPPLTVGVCAVPGSYTSQPAPWPSNSGVPVSGMMRSISPVGWR